LIICSEVDGLNFYELTELSGMFKFDENIYFFWLGLGKINSSGIMLLFINFGAFLMLLTLAFELLVKSGLLIKSY
jgi:hypothetical protein